MITSDTQLETPKPVPAGESPKDDIAVNSHPADNVGAPVLDGELHHTERLNVNAMREAIETQSEMEVGKPVDQKQEEVKVKEKEVTVDKGTGGTQIIINIAGKKKQLTFSNSATATAFIKGASAKFGSKFSVIAGEIITLKPGDRISWHLSKFDVESRYGVVTEVLPKNDDGLVIFDAKQEDLGGNPLHDAWGYMGLIWEINGQQVKPIEPYRAEFEIVSNVAPQQTLDNNKPTTSGISDIGVSNPTFKGASTREYIIAVGNKKWVTKDPTGNLMLTTSMRNAYKYDSFDNGAEAIKDATVVKNGIAKGEQTRVVPVASMPTLVASQKTIKTAWTVGIRGVMHTYIWAYNPQDGLVLSDKEKWHGNLEGGSGYESQRGVIVLNTKEKTGYVLSYKKGRNHEDADFIPNNIWKVIRQKFKGYKLEEKKGMEEAVNKDWNGFNADGARYMNYFLRGLRNELQPPRQFASKRAENKKTQFTGTEDWEAVTKADDWCKTNGYSVGPMQGDAPRGIILGTYSVMKWRNLSEEDKQRLDGIMTSDDFRNGPTVTVELYNKDFSFSKEDEALLGGMHITTKEGSMKQAGGMNFSPSNVPSEVVQQFYPDLLHEIIDYPNATNAPMVNPEISGDMHELGTAPAEGIGEAILQNENLDGGTLPVEDIDGELLPGALEDAFDKLTIVSYVSTSPAGACGIGRDGKSQVLEGAPLRKENDIRGPMFTDEFYANYQAVPGAALAALKEKVAGADEKKQFALFLKRVMGEVAASFIAAFKVTSKMPMNKVPGVGEIQLAQIEQSAPVGTWNIVNTGSRVKYLMDKLTDSEIQDAINDAFAQGAVWHEAKEGGFVFEVFVRAETIDTDSMILKYKFITGTREADNEN